MQGPAQPFRRPLAASATSALILVSGLAGCLSGNESADLTWTIPAGVAGDRVRTSYADGVSFVTTLGPVEEIKDCSGGSGGAFGASHTLALRESGDPRGGRVFGPPKATDYYSAATGHYVATTGNIGFTGSHITRNCPHASQDAFFPNHEGPFAPPFGYALLWGIPLPLRQEIVLEWDGMTYSFLALPNETDTSQLRLQMEIVSPWRTSNLSVEWEFGTGQAYPQTVKVLDPGRHGGLQVKNEQEARGSGGLLVPKNRALTDLSSPATGGATAGWRTLTGPLGASARFPPLDLPMRLTLDSALSLAMVESGLAVYLRDHPQAFLASAFYSDGAPILYANNSQVVTLGAPANRTSWFLYFVDPTSRRPAPGDPAGAASYDGMVIQVRTYWPTDASPVPVAHATGIAQPYFGPPYWGNVSQELLVPPLPVSEILTALDREILPVTFAVWDGFGNDAVPSPEFFKWIIMTEPLAPAFQKLPGADYVPLPAILVSSTRNLLVNEQECILEPWPGGWALGCGHAFGYVLSSNSPNDPAG